MSAREPDGMPPELREALDARPDAARVDEVWRLLGKREPAPPTAAADAARAEGWRKVQAAIALNETPVQPLRSRRRIWLAAAAALMLAAGVGVRAAGRSELVAEPGRAARVVLPDGSLAQLDGGSRLVWRRGFAGWFGGLDREREVRLDGAGYFEVRRDGRPFIVRTFNADVRVLGTRFGVHAWDNAGGGTAVEVAEGRVRVAGRSAAVELAAGQRTDLATRATTPTAPGAVAPERVAAWRSGGFASVDATLGAIVHDLERHYGVRIQLRNRAASAQRLTLYYPSPSGVQAILADLCTARGLTFRPVRGGYEVE